MPVLNEVITLGQRSLQINALGSSCSLKTMAGSWSAQALT